MSRGQTITPAVRRLVLRRDGNRCRRCGVEVDVRAGAYSLQHRRPKGAGGSRLAEANLPGNLVTLCGSATTGCHGEVESHRDDAFAEGFLLRQSTRLPPARVPVLTVSGWFRFDNDGGEAPVDETEALRLMFELGLRE